MLHCALKAVNYVQAKFKIMNKILQEMELAVRSTKDFYANAVNHDGALARM